jgi:hypothetical protein
VHDSPAPGAEVVAEIAVTQDEALEWTDTHVLVTVPRPLTAKRDMDLGRPTVFDPQTQEFLEGSPEVSIRKGEVLEYLKYGGEGDCYVRVHGVVYMLYCPEAADFHGEFGDETLEPLEQSFWVRVAEGWVKVVPQSIRYAVRGP